MSLVTKKKIDVNGWEMTLDKAVDLVLIFVGLYLAIGVQDCQDRQAERQNYLTLLRGFKQELAHNQAQRVTLEKELGPVGERATGQVLGPTQRRFDDFRAEIEQAQKLIDCLGVLIDFAHQPPRAAADLERVQTCGTLLEQAERDAAAEKKFQLLSLAPFYRQDVWQLYLANGVKVFENQELAIQIGSVYSKTKDVERKVAEVEGLFNESFVQRAGEVTASLAELEDLTPAEAGGDVRKAAEQMGRLREKLHALAKELRGHKYGAAKILGMMEMKVERLKELMAEMDSQFTALAKGIEEELARQGA